MSSDGFGAPAQRLRFGKSGSLAQQGYVVGPSYKMPLYLCWARSDSVALAGAGAAYLVFDVPPLPIGSVVRAHVAVSTATGSEIVGLGIGLDYLGAVGNVTTFGSTPFSGAGLVIVQMAVRTRTSASWAQVLPGTQGAGTAGGTAPDFARSNRMAVYGTVATALTIAHALVEAFIPKVYP